MELLEFANWKPYDNKLNKPYNNKKLNSYAEYNVDSHDEDPKFEVDDHVGISKLIKKSKIQFHWHI